MNTNIKRLVVSAILVTASHPAIAIDCDSPSSDKWMQERYSICLKTPGWFDVGAGIVVIPKAGVAQQNGVGNMVSVRAYPFGRWYAPLKTLTPTSSQIIQVKLAAAKQLEDNVVQKRTEILQKTKDAEAKEKVASAKEALAKGSKDSQVTNAATVARKSADDSKSDADKSTSDNSTLINQSDAANKDLALSMQTALSDFSDNYAVAEYNSFRHWGSRMSFFLGRSVSGFDSKVVDGDINSFGIAFDIAPEFSLVWGRAYFNQPAQTGVVNNSKSATVIGVQINFNAFKTLRGLTGSL